jgi:hypothetical protein
MRAHRKKKKEYNTPVQVVMVHLEHLHELDKLEVRRRVDEARVPVDQSVVLADPFVSELSY